MSETNVERARRWSDAFNRRDIEALIANSDPGIEFQSTFAAVGGAIYHGHDGLRSWHRDLGDVWRDEFRAEPEAYFDLGQQTLVFYDALGRGTHSGVEVAMPIAVVYTWRAGLMISVKAYAHREDALSDLGVSMDELEPINP